MSVWDLCTAHWNLDDLVEEVGGLDLTNTNSTTFVAGALGDCANFVGASSQKLSVASDAAVSHATKWSASFWYKTASGGNGAWIGKGVYSSPGYEWAVRPIDNSSVWVYISSTGTDFPYGQFNLGTNFLSTDNWHHCVVVFDGAGATDANRLRVWSDAVEKTGSYSGSIPATMFTGSGDFILGGMFSNLLGNSTIRLDHVSFFAGTALTQADVDELFNGGTPLEFAGGGPPDDVVESPGSAIALAGASAADALLVPGSSAAGAGGRAPAQLLAVGSSSVAAGATPAHAASTTGPALAAAGATAAGATLGPGAAAAAAGAAPAGSILATGTASAGATARPAASILSGLVAAAAAAARALWAFLAPGRASAAATATLPTSSLPPGPDVQVGQFGGTRVAARGGIRTGERGGVRASSRRRS